MFGALGVKVTVVDQRDRVLNFLDGEIVEAFQYALRRRNVTFRLRERVNAIEPLDGRGGRVELASGKEIRTETVLYAVGRQGATDGLQLERAGLQADRRGRLAVDESFRTGVPHIYAVGDVIGFPALAATSMEQGRAAAYHACGEPVGRMHNLQPIGIYTIPEISFVGRTEDQLTEDRVPFEVGISRYRELARGQIIGDSKGLIKLVFDPQSLTLLGVHIIGENASELLHVGMVVMQFGGTINAFIDSVFNFPTLSEGYKYAAYDGLGNVARRSHESDRGDHRGTPADSRQSVG
jgi:NAD(P) transhydrogenase